MKCPMCGGDMQRQDIVHDVHFKEDMYSFTDVPAWSCDSCGDIVLDNETVEKINHVIKSHQKPEKFLKVPLYSLSKV